MESFFRRVSSIVRKNSNKDFDPDENEQENHQRQASFREMQQRRRSAPAIRRSSIPVDKLPMESDQKITSIEQINSENQTVHSNTINLTRKHWNPTSKIFLFNSVN
jgi:hypothetical protein